MSITTFDEFILPNSLVDKIEKLKSLAKIVFSKKTRATNKSITVACFKNDIYFGDFDSINKTSAAIGLKKSIVQYYFSMQKLYIDKDNNKWLFIGVES